MDRLLENWLEETLGNGDALVEVPRTRPRAAIYAAIANYGHLPGFSPLARISSSKQ